jgi:hypothetical protein
MQVMGPSAPTSMSAVRVPEMMPLLSRGKHRRPRNGACFMELASFVAGEPWSDHPACTHPLLASLARLVNDATSDDARQHLAPLIPDVIGLTSDDPRVDVRIALRSATAALPVVAEPRQRPLAAAVIAANRLLDEMDDLCDRPADRLEEESRWALGHVPGAARWAEEFTDLCSPSVAGFRRRGAPYVLRTAVEGIARACVPDPDRLLRDLLRTTIDECAAWIDRDRGDSPAPAGRGTRVRDRPRLARLARH